MRLVVLAVVVVAGIGCNEDGIDYEGMPGQAVPVSFAQWVPIIDATPGMSATGSFLLDTGAPLTVFDSTSYPGYEVGSQTASLTAFALTFLVYPVVIFDLFGGDDRGLDGIIGSDLTRNFALSLDYRDDRAWLDDDWAGELPTGVAPADVDTTEQVEIELRGGGVFAIPGDGTFSTPASRVLLLVEIEDRGFVWMMVDTGASSVVLDMAFAATLDGIDRPRLEGVTVGTANGTQTAYFTRVWRMRVGGAELRSVSALVVEDEAFLASLELETGRPVKGLIGGSFLRSFLTTIDGPGRRLALSKYIEQDHIDADEFVRAGFTMTNRGDVWEVRDVNPNTDAAAQGLRPGEEIAEIDGVTIAGETDVVVAALLGRFGLGDDIPVGVSRGGTLEVLNIEVEDLLPTYDIP